MYSKEKAGEQSALNASDFGVGCRRRTAFNRPTGLKDASLSLFTNAVVLFRCRRSLIATWFTRWWRYSTTTIFLTSPLIKYSNSSATREPEPWLFYAILKVSILNLTPFSA